MRESFLQIEGITKVYDKRITALSGVSFQVERGQVVGLVGPNGSGKSTLIKILLGLVNPDKGQVYINHEKPLEDNSRKVSAVLEYETLFPFFNAQENLEITTLTKSLPKQEISRVLKFAGLDKRKEKVKKFSLGMRRRLMIAAALMGDPGLIILDEPTNGLDQIAIGEIKTLIRKLADSGITVIVASHALADVEKICSHIGFLLNGELKVYDPVQAYITQHGSLDNAFHHFASKKTSTL